MSKKKNTLVFNRRDIYRSVSKKVKYSGAYIKLIYRAIEDTMYEILSQADENNDVELRLFEGINLKSEYLKPKEKINNLTGEMIQTKGKIKCKANVSRTYSEKLSANE